MSHSTTDNDWSPNSWRSKPIKQVPIYPDPQAVIEIEESLTGYPPLVFAGEARKLQNQLAKVAAGEAFLLQGGDCAESFFEHGPNQIRDFLRLVLQMSAVMTFSSQKPVIKVGRIAGQFAKPRSADIEKIGEQELPSYRGDIINGIDFTAEARIPDPHRMIMAYRQSAATLNLLRAFVGGGYANLEQVHNWMLDFVTGTEQSEKYQHVADQIGNAIKFMRACGINPENTPALSNIDFYTSHEALLLGYEEAFTRQDSTTGDYYATSGHMIWIGDRTRQLDHAHIEYCRGIKNPIGLKCGPSLEPSEAIKLIDILNPENIAGRITLITRYGKDEIHKYLPQLIKEVKKSGQNVIWSCDPMHGNTVKSSSGYKTRPFDDIFSEVRQFFDIHNGEGSIAGGLHIEMTGKNVTECTGGVYHVSDEDLGDRYHTHCDPRLNASQALELAFEVSEMLKAK